MSKTWTKIAAQKIHARGRMPCKEYGQHYAPCKYRQMFPLGNVCTGKLCFMLLLLDFGVELFAMKGCKYMHVWFPADVKKYALHGGRHCVLLKNKDGLMVFDGFRPFT